jgi:hypothetical protein
MAGSPPKPPPPAPFSHPFYAELIDSYLRPWVASGDKTGEFIHEADPYGVAPGVLTGQFPSATAGDGVEAWCFFTKLQYTTRVKDCVKRMVDNKEGTWVSSSPARPVRSEPTQVLSTRALSVCLVGEPRERSGAAPLPRPFGWGAAGAERLPREYTLYMRVGSVP